MKEELIRVAHYYYVLKLNQQEIAEKMAMSRQRVGRLLKRAEEEGVVEIRVHGYSDSCARIEDSLREKAGHRGRARRPFRGRPDHQRSGPGLHRKPHRAGPQRRRGLWKDDGAALQGPRKSAPGGIKVVQLLGGLNAFQNADYKPDEVASRWPKFSGNPVQSVHPRVAEQR